MSDLRIIIGNFLCDSFQLYFKEWGRWLYSDNGIVTVFLTFLADNILLIDSFQRCVFFRLV